MNAFSDGDGKKIGTGRKEIMNELRKGARKRARNGLNGRL